LSVIELLQEHGVPLPLAADILLADDADQAVKAEDLSWNMKHQWRMKLIKQ
jgi:hypothetical protein